MGSLGVNIGLNSVNVTLKALPLNNQSSDIDYNERFHWDGATQIREEYRAALHKGLPFPILIHWKPNPPPNYLRTNLLFILLMNIFYFNKRYVKGIKK